MSHSGPGLRPVVPSPDPAGSQRYQRYQLSMRRHCLLGQRCSTRQHYIAGQDQATSQHGGGRASGTIA